MVNVTWYGIECYFTAERVTDELNKFLKQHKGEDIILFFDNHSMHWSNEMFAWVTSRSGKYNYGTIDIYFLPKYAPLSTVAS